MSKIFTGELVSYQDNPAYCDRTAGWNILEKGNAEKVRKSYYTQLTESDRKIADYISKALSKYEDFPMEVTLDLKEIADILGLDPKADFQEIFETVCSLRSKSIWLEYSKKSKTTGGWLDSVKASPKYGVVIVTLDADFAKYLYYLDFVVGADLDAA